MTPLLPFFIDRSEGESSDPFPSSHCYRSAQHHEQLIPHNFQPYGRQNHYPIDRFGSKRTPTKACTRGIWR